MMSTSSTGSRLGRSPTILFTVTPGTAVTRLRSAVSPIATRKHFVREKGLVSGNRPSVVRISSKFAVTGSNR